MKTIQGISQYHDKQATIITIGTFDGVHIGHRKILHRLINHAKLNGFKSVLLTFFPHPRMVLQKDAAIKLLNTLDEKIAILDGLGLDYLVIHPFTKEFSRLTAVEFVRDILVNQLRTKKIIIGYDHRFGRNRIANITDLKHFGETFSFEVEEIQAQDIDDVAVSSTKIRKALLDADIETANTYLGYPYMLNGTIKKGKGIGKSLGFPTANLHIDEAYKLIPKNGVYAVRCKVDHIETAGMMNIGINPTLEGSEQSIEINLFGVDEDLYGKKLTVEMLSHIRSEQKFESIEALKDQLKHDRQTALKLTS